MRFTWLVAGPVRPQQNLQAGFKRQNADRTRVLGDFDRPVSGNRRVFLDQPLNYGGGEQHGIDIVGQRRAVMAGAVHTLDRIADVKSVKRHEIKMPSPRGGRFDIDQMADFAPGNLGRNQSCGASIRRRLLGPQHVHGPILPALCGALVQLTELPGRTFPPSA
jgi:hypothetical protein